MRASISIALLLCAVACGGENGSDEPRNQNEPRPGETDGGGKSNDPGDEKSPAQPPDRYFDCADGSNLCAFCDPPFVFDACTYHGDPACPAGSVNLIRESCDTCGDAHPINCYVDCREFVAAQCIDGEWRCVDGTTSGEECG